MGKMRNAGTDIGQLVQWFGRKCRNHHPLEELSLPQGNRQSQPTTYKSKVKGSVFTVADSEDTLVYVAGGRNFLVQIREASEEEVAEMKLVAVGH